MRDGRTTPAFDALANWSADAVRAGRAAPSPGER
jgi:hypothetical protein